MKKFLLGLLCVMLVAVMALALVACGGTDAGDAGDAGNAGDAAATGKVNPNDPKKDVSDYSAKGEWTTINNKLSWDGINSFKTKDDVADNIEEARKLCVDFFRYAKTALWIADDNFSYWHMKKDADANNPYTLNQEEGMVCGGVPYIYVASGSIYRLMDYMDEEKGVVKMEDFIQSPHLYGNQCSIGSYWGWARVINSAKYDWTQNMVESNGFLRVGDYQYNLLTNAWSDGYKTTTILEENGREKMYECYAQLKAGDGIVYYTTAGHVVMISADAHVEYLDEAKTQIDPDKSYVLVIDQTPTEADGTNEAGDSFIYEKNVDEKWSFKKLFDGNYAPFTYAEWLGTDPIEKTENTINHTGDTIDYEGIYKLKMTSNYGISDLYVSIYNADGVEVWKAACRATQAGRTELKFTTGGTNVHTWGDFEKLDPANYEYTVKVYAQLGTGERPTLWEGKLAA